MVSRETPVWREARAFFPWLWGHFDVGAVGGWTSSAAGSAARLPPQNPAQQYAASRWRFYESMWQGRRLQCASNTYLKCEAAAGDRWAANVYLLCLKSLNVALDMVGRSLWLGSS